MIVKKYRKLKVIRAKKLGLMKLSSVLTPRASATNGGRARKQVDRVNKLNASLYLDKAPSLGTMKRFASGRAFLFAFIMGTFHSKEDDVARISTSVYVSNLPDSINAKDLFHACKQYGHVVDSFIPFKRDKYDEGEYEWPGGKTFAGAVKGRDLPIGGDTKSNSVLVLGDKCLVSKDLSLALLGRVKEFASLANLKVAIGNEGFSEIGIKYMGELWVKLKEEVKVDLKKEMKVDLKEEMKADLKEEMRTEIQDMLVDYEMKVDLKEEMKADLKEEMKNELKEQMREELKEEMREELKEEMQKTTRGAKYPMANIAEGNLSNNAKAFAVSLCSEEIPSSFEQALKSEKWKKAMDDEMKALKKNKTWDQCALPQGKKPVGCRWIFTVKYKPDETVERYKAR
nr:putative reverse transcriptase, RNA-dependent DNA polymerase [Tanacetum cinerariifolium]